MVAEGTEPSPEVVDGEGASFINPRVFRLPIGVDVAIPIRKFRVRNLLALTVGAVILIAVGTGRGPASGGQRRAVGMGLEFEVVDQKLAVRITRLV